MGEAKDKTLMQVAILTGGRGERLRPITDEMPKPMVPVCGRPFLEHQLELIDSFGLKEIILLSGYLGSHIEAYFGNGSRFGVDIKYSYEKEPLGTAGALKNAEDKLEDEFLLMNGDTYLPIDYKEMINYFRKYDKRGLVVAYANRDSKIPNNIAVDKSNLVISYNKKEPSKMTHIDAGVAAFKKDILDLIPEDRSCSLEEEIFVRLIEMRELAAFPTNQRFYDMGSPDGLMAVERVLR